MFAPIVDCSRLIKLFADALQQARRHCETLKNDLAFGQAGNCQNELFEIFRSRCGSSENVIRDIYQRDSFFFFFFFKTTVSTKRGTGNYNTTCVERNKWQKECSRRKRRIVLLYNKR